MNCNPGDEEIRRLERAVAEGQHGAPERLGIAYERRGRCRCGSSQIAGYTAARQPRCPVDAARDELAALEASTTTYEGSWSDAMPDPRGLGLFRGFVLTPQGFPLAVSSRFGYYYGWRHDEHETKDRWGRLWRAKGEPSVKMRMRRLAAIPAGPRSRAWEPDRLILRPVPPTRGEDFWLTYPHSSEDDGVHLLWGAQEQWLRDGQFVMPRPTDLCFCRHEPDAHGTELGRCQFCLCDDYRPHDSALSFTTSLCRRCGHAWSGHAGPLVGDSCAVPGCSCRDFVP